MPVTIEAKFTGPLFDGRFNRMMLHLPNVLAYDVAAQASADLHQYMNQDFRHPTPYYETQVLLHSPHGNVWQIDDRGIIYGPWLEGTSLRNQATRFKGYHIWRRAWQSALNKAEAICQAAVTKMLAGMR
jgi:hypothetical protein